MSEVNDTKDRIKKRLADLYRGRATAETNLVKSLRYVTDMKKVNERIDTLVEYRGRIQELEYMLPTKEIDEIKKEANVIE